MVCEHTPELRTVVGSVCAGVQQGGLEGREDRTRRLTLDDLQLPFAPNVLVLVVQQRSSRHTVVAQHCRTLAVVEQRVRSSMGGDGRHRHQWLIADDGPDGIDDLAGHGPDGSAQRVPYLRLLVRIARDLHVPPFIVPAGAPPQRDPTTVEVEGARVEVHRVELRLRDRTGPGIRVDTAQRDCGQVLHLVLAFDLHVIPSGHPPSSRISVGARKTHPGGATANRPHANADPRAAQALALC